MEFKFNVNEVFKGAPIVEINQTLIPNGFAGDRRALWDTVSKVSEVVNAMGDASATAQGLSKPITTSERLRNSDQILYLLIDKEAKEGKGVVTGMLKTGQKNLYVFDRNGQYYQVTPSCILDFYVHESRQRTGLGKQLFDHMLEKENTTPAKLAVDRPSDKLLSFLDRHYGLSDGIPQSNNYVVFDKFFPGIEEPQKPIEDTSVLASPRKFKEAANGLQQNFSNSPYGRYGAPRPICSMAQIIHNQSAVQSNEPSGLSLNIKPAASIHSASNAKSKQQLSSNTSRSGEEKIDSIQSVRATKSIPSQNAGFQLTRNTTIQMPITHEVSIRSDAPFSNENAVRSATRLEALNESSQQAQSRDGIATPLQNLAGSRTCLQTEQVSQNDTPQEGLKSPTSNEGQTVTESQNTADAV